MRKMIVCLLVLAGISLYVCGCKEEEKSAVEDLKPAEAPAAEVPKDHPAH